ncbi:MAG: hypothetical protein JW881_00020 [Spirochaetales bacterium]|nr:hypothetical protein [Spirochaetales bacterium]
MEYKRRFRLRLMYRYNIVVTGGFAVWIALMTFIPALRNCVLWNGFEPVTASLVVPLFIVMAAFSVRFLSRPREGILLLKIQVFYKPLAVGLVIYFTLQGMIHPLWSLIVTAGLLVYIIGNIWAIPWKGDEEP